MSLMTDQAIAERARQQLGLLTRPQARAAGLSSKSISDLVARGRLEPLGARTLRVAGVPDTLDSRIMAACLDSGGVGWLRTSWWMLGLKGAVPPSTVEVLVASRRGATRSDLAVVHRTTSLPPDDVTSVRGVPVASVARTVLGLCSCIPTEMSLARLDDIVEDAICRDLASMRWLWWFLEERRCRGRRGVAAMEHLLSERARMGPTESWLERETLLVLDAAGLPKPELQQVIRADGAFVSRVDLAYPAERVVIEVEGKTHLTTERHGRDAEQRNLLQMAGWVVLTFTYDDVVRRPDWVASMVRKALAR